MLVHFHGLTNATLDSGEFPRVTGGWAEPKSMAINPVEALFHPIRYGHGIGEEEPSEYPPEIEWWVSLDASHHETPQRLDELPTISVRFQYDSMVNRPTNHYRFVRGMVQEIPSKDQRHPVKWTCRTSPDIEASSIYEDFQRFVVVQQ